MPGPASPQPVRAGERRQAASDAARHAACIAAPELSRRAEKSRLRGGFSTLSGGERGIVGCIRAPDLFALGAARPAFGCPDLLLQIRRTPAGGLIRRLSASQTKKPPLRAAFSFIWRREGDCRVHPCTRPLRASRCEASLRLSGSAPADPSNPGGGAHPPSLRQPNKKAAPAGGFLVWLAERGGLSGASVHPTSSRFALRGQPSAVRICSCRSVEPRRGCSSAVSPPAKQKSRPCGRLSRLSGGERGIRTPEARFRRLHTFQACSFNHSDTSPDPVAGSPQGRRF